MYMMKKGLQSLQNSNLKHQERVAVIQDCAQLSLKLGVTGVRCRKDKYLSTSGSMWSSLYTCSSIELQGDWLFGAVCSSSNELHELLQGGDICLSYEGVKIVNYLVLFRAKDW